MAENTPPFAPRPHLPGTAAPGKEIARLSAEVQMLREREKSGNFLAAVVDSSQDSIVTIDFSGKITTWNAAAERLYGYPPAEAIGRPLAMLTLPEDLVGVLERIEQVKESRRVDTYDTLRVCKGGQKIWLSTTLSPVKNEDGDVIGLALIARDISERKASEEALRVSEEQFRRAIEEAPIPMIMHAEDGQVLQISRTWTELTGYRPEEIPTFDAWLNKAYGPGAGKVRTHVHRLFSGKARLLDVEIEIITHTGAHRSWAFSASAPGTLRDGRRFIVGMALDITHRKQVEEALRKSDARLRLAQEAGQVGIWDWDLRTRESSWSQTLWRLFGYETPPPISARTAWAKHVAPEDRQRLQQALHSLQESTETDFRDEFQIRRCDGQSRWLESIARVVRDEAGRALGMSGVNIDITARKSSEVALSASEERFRLMMENAREYAIIAMGLDRKVHTWNAGAERLLGFAAEEILGKSADVIFTEEDRRADMCRKEAETALVEGKAADERWHIRKDGSRFWGSGAMMAMHDARGKAVGLVKIFRDQTRERRAKQELEASRADLLKALKENEQVREEIQAASQAKDHFLAILSHELRSPLNPVTMTAGTLQRRTDLDPAVRRGLEIISRNITMECRLIDDLLDMTRIIRGKLEIIREMVDLHEVIHEAAETVRTEIAEKKQNFTILLEAEKPMVNGDPTRLKQAVWNLLRNASKFTKPEGTIHLHTHNEGNRIVVGIRDNGIGIPPQKLDSIFEAFSQADQGIARRFGGLGLGLAITKAIVDSHEGYIRAMSGGPDAGATLIFNLPVALSDPTENQAG